MALGERCRLISACAQEANPRKTYPGLRGLEVDGGTIEISVISGIAPKERVRRRNVMVHTYLSIILPLRTERWIRGLIPWQVRQGVQTEEGLDDLWNDSRTGECGGAGGRIG